MIIKSIKYYIRLCFMQFSQFIGLYANQPIVTNLIIKTEYKNKIYYKKKLN